MSTPVSITIDNKGKASASPNPCYPDSADEKITFTIDTAGYHFNTNKGFDNCGISIKNKNGTFTLDSSSATSVTVSDDGSDNENKHNYTLHIKADSTGEEIDYDPMIKDRDNN
jgi:hypothetical protein